MDNILIRFYAVSEVFRDDERLISCAVKEYTKVKDTKCSIYKDLLNCKYGKWIDKIERVAPLICEEWIEYRLFMMDNGHDKNFIMGDIRAIEAICYEDE